MFHATDSLLYGIKAENITKDYYKNKELFNFSNYLERSKYYDDTNRLVVGKIKDETDGQPIKHLKTLKAKISSYITEDDHKCKRTKGIDKNVNNKKEFEDKKNILTSIKNMSGMN